MRKRERERENTCVYVCMYESVKPWQGEEMCEE